MNYKYLIILNTILYIVSHRIDDIYVKGIIFSISMTMSLGILIYWFLSPNKYDRRLEKIHVDGEFDVFYRYCRDNSIDTDNLKKYDYENLFYRFEQYKILDFYLRIIKKVYTSLDLSNFIKVSGKEIILTVRYDYDRYNIHIKNNFLIDEEFHAIPTILHDEFYLMVHQLISLYYDLERDLYRTKNKYQHTNYKKANKPKEDKKEPTKLGKLKETLRLRKEHLSKNYSEDLANEIKVLEKKIELLSKKVA